MMPLYCPNANMAIPFYSRLCDSLGRYSLNEILLNSISDPLSDSFQTEVERLKKAKQPHLIQDLYTQNFFASRLSKEFQRDDKVCFGCWLKSSVCICKNLKSVVSNYVNLHIYMNHKEFLRRSNSAKMLFSCVRNSQLYFEGLEEHLKQLSPILDKESTLVLYPKNESKTISEYVQEMGSELKLPVDLVLIDGTYNNVGSMVRRVSKKFPKCTFVKLDGTHEKEKESMFVLRDQTSERKKSGKVCSAEAVGYALEQFLGAMGSNEGRIQKDILFKNLSVLINTVESDIGWTKKKL